MTALEVCTAWGENLPSRSSSEDSQLTYDQIGILYNAYDGVRAVLPRCPDPGW